MRKVAIGRKELERLLRNPSGARECPTVHFYKGDALDDHMAIVPLDLVNAFEGIVFSLLRKRFEFEYDLVDQLCRQTSPKTALRYMKAFRAFLYTCGITPKLLPSGQVIEDMLDKKILGIEDISDDEDTRAYEGDDEDSDIDCADFRE